jgi:hypothetical protein
MNSTQTFTWKRQPDGHYVARHGFWVYDVWRNDRAAKGRQWNLTAYPEANAEAAQERSGFANLKTARLAAERTHCFICGRHFPFGTLKRQPGRSQLSYPTWVCRDEKPCRAERDRLTGERERADAPRDYADTLAEIVKAKARVRQLESDALKLHDKARELGTPEHELRAIEQQHGFGLPAIPYTGE